MFAPEKSARLFNRLSTAGGIIFLLCVFVLAVAPAAGQQESVVFINTEAGSGYGVAYGNPGNVVTALHVVAGRSKIFVKWKNQESPATIEKIYKPADLALLRVQTPLNIPTLEIYSGDAPTDTDLNYWVAAEKTFKMGGKTTQLKETTALGKLNTRLEKHQAGFAKALCSDGKIVYPALTTSVLNFEEPNIEKKHSGSPLTYGDQIVGIVDGGQPLAGKGVVWAIPAAEFENLQKLGTPASALRQACSSKNLYSGLRADNPHLTPELAELAKAIEASEENPLRFADDSGDQLVFDLEYRAPFRDIYDTMFEEDQGYVKDLVQENEADVEEGQVTLDDLYDQSLDFYLEEETGATIAVPTASELSLEKEGGHTLIEASSPYQGITMIIFAQKTNSLEKSKEAMEWFKEYIVSDREDWTAETGEGDETENLLKDPDEPYYSELFERVVHNGDDLVAELYASLTIDGNNFLGVAVKINDWSTLDDSEERIFFYLMEACAILTDFAYY